MTDLRSQVAHLRTLVEEALKFSVRQGKVKGGGNEYRDIFVNGYLAASVWQMKTGTETYLRVVLPDKTFVQGDWKDVSSTVATVKQMIKTGTIPMPTPKEGEKPRVTGYSLTPEQKEYLKAGILKCVTDDYARYRQKKADGFQVKEPEITVGELFYHFDQFTSWGPLTIPRHADGSWAMSEQGWKKVLRTHVWKVAEQLRKQGKLGSSLGTSGRCYEPAE